MVYRNVVHLHHGSALHMQSSSTDVEFVNTQSRALCFPKDPTLVELVDKVRQEMDVEESSLVRLEGRYDAGIGPRSFCTMIPLTKDYAWDDYKTMVGESCMMILVIYVVVEPGHNLSDIALNRMLIG